METLLDGGSFFEGPRWRDGRWWVSDFLRHRVIAVDPDGREEHVLTVEGRPSGLGWMPDGSLLVVSMTDRRVLRSAPDGGVSVHADVSELCGGYLNDHGSPPPSWLGTCASGCPCSRAARGRRRPGSGHSGRRSRGASSCCPATTA